MVNISNYVSGTSKNYGVNSLLVSIGNIDLYFSYRTIVAFRYNGELVVSENCFSATTGKHLNSIDGGNKENRLKRSDFESRLATILEHCPIVSIA